MLHGGSQSTNSGHRGGDPRARPRTPRTASARIPRATFVADCFRNFPHDWHESWHEKAAKQGFRDLHKHRRDRRSRNTLDGQLPHDLIAPRRHIIKRRRRTMPINAQNGLIGHHTTPSIFFLFDDRSFFRGESQG